MEHGQADIASLIVMQMQIGCTCISRLVCEKQKVNYSVLHSNLGITTRPLMMSGFSCVYDVGGIRSVSKGGREGGRCMVWLDYIECVMLTLYSAVW